MPFQWVLCLCWANKVMITSTWTLFEKGMPPILQDINWGAVSFMSPFHPQGNLLCAPPRTSQSQTLTARTCLYNKILRPFNFLLLSPLHWTSPGIFLCTVRGTGVRVPNYHRNARHPASCFPSCQFSRLEWA